MKNLIKDWQTYWTILFVVMLLAVSVPDIFAVIKGHHDHLGDQLSFTHWLVTHVGLSIIGAFIGYLIAHFLIVHKNG